MQHSNKVEKISSRKNLAWYEEGKSKKGDKRNKPARNNSKRDNLDSE